MVGEIIDAFGDDLETITLVRGSSGVFDVELDGATVFSKHQVKRHPELGEVVGKLQEMVGSDEGLTSRLASDGQYHADGG